MMIPANLLTFRLDDNNPYAIAVTPVVTRKHERIRLVLSLVKSGFENIKDDIVLMREFIHHDDPSYYYRTPVDRYTDYGLACKEFAFYSANLFKYADEVIALT
jgi:hypothetical protein